MNKEEEHARETVGRFTYPTPGKQVSLRREMVLMCFFGSMSGCAESNLAGGTLGC